MSSSTFGELCFAAAKSVKKRESMQVLVSLKELIPVLALDANTTLQYGQIRQYLQHISRPFGNNDL
jgi:predicted nucleic acid-binding protein